MNRRVGRSAETRFATLCAEAGAICNEPKEDESGWDFVVTLPKRRGVGVSADMSPPPPPVLVQVKSHVAKHRRLTVKLSNALTFAHSPLPCFLVLMLLPDAGEPVIYATHVWESMISRTFKRAREAARDGVAEDRLHKQTMTVSFTEEDRHDHDLLAWMEATVAGQGRDYAAAKRHLQDTVGFEGGNVGGVLQIGPLSSIEELVDHQLGLSPSIRMSKVTLQSRRFGIALDLPMPKAPVTYARLTSNPVDACVIRLRGPDREELTVDAEVIVPAIDVPDNQFKARFRSPIVDIIWAWGGESRITGYIDTAAAMTPDLLYKMARIAGWAGQGIIDMKVEARDQRLLGSVARMDGFPDADRWAILADLIAPLVEIARVRKVEPPKITIEQLLECEWLEPFFRFVTQSDMIANVILGNGVAAPVAERAIMFALVQVDRWVFCVLVQQSIREQSQEGERWTIRFDKPEQLERYVFRDDDAASIRALEADYQRYSQTPGTLGLGNALLRVNPAGPAITLDGEQAI